MQGARFVEEPTMTAVLAVLGVMDRTLDGRLRQKSQSPSGPQVSHLDSRGVDLRPRP